MNLRGRYNMLRQAALQLVGLPTDNLVELKQLAEHLRVVATVDAQAAVSLLMLQTLIVTHSDAERAEVVAHYEAAANHIAREIINEVDDFTPLRANPDYWQDCDELVALVDAILTGVPNVKRN